jgi:hypothetical protein
MTTDHKKQGKKNRASGARFELKCREELEADGWFISKWQNNIDLVNEKIVKARPKFNPFTKSLMMNGAGFPDYIAFKPAIDIDDSYLHQVKFVECKKKGYLTQEEKKKCQILTKLTGCKVEVMKDEKR